MLDKILVYLLQRKINKYMSDLNFNTYIAATRSDKSIQVINLDRHNKNEISKAITILEDALRVIKN